MAINVMKGEATVLQRGRRKSNTVMKKLRQMKMLLMIMLTITTKIRVITAVLVLMKMIVSETAVRSKGMIIMTSMINQNQYALVASEYTLYRTK